MKVDIAIISAFPEEIADINNAIPEGIIETTQIGNFKICEYKKKSILITATGMGTTNAAVIMGFIVAHFQPNYILFTGTAGGIDPRLNIGDVVIATSAFEAEIQGAFQTLPGTDFESALIHPIKKAPLQQKYLLDSSLAELVMSLIGTTLPTGAKIYQGLVVTTNTFPSPPSLFSEIKKYAPWAIDMESSAIYQAAWALNTKSIVIRGISNKLDTFGQNDPSHKTDIKGSTRNASTVLLQILDKLEPILSLSSFAQPVIR